MNTDIDNLNLIYCKLVFLYKKDKIPLNLIPDITYIKNLINTLPSQMSNIDDIYFICKTFGKSFNMLI